VKKAVDKKNRMTNATQVIKAGAKLSWLSRA